MMRNEGMVQLHERTIGEVAVFDLDGRLTVNDAPGTLRATIEAAQDRGLPHVVLNLAGVGYVDSTRLGELLSAHVSLSRRGGRLLLAAVPTRVAELLHLAGLDRVFPRFASVEDAVASLHDA